MAEMTLTAEDRQVLKGILDAEVAAGRKALIPLDVDIDGDGIVDAWGLDEHGEVVLISGVTLTSTVYESDGDDIRAGE